MSRFTVKKILPSRGRIAKRLGRVRTKCLKVQKTQLRLIRVSSFPLLTVSVALSVLYLSKSIAVTTFSLVSKGDTKANAEVFLKIVRAMRRHHLGSAVYSRVVVHVGVHVAAPFRRELPTDVTL